MAGVTGGGALRTGNSNLLTCTMFLLSVLVFPVFVLRKTKFKLIFCVQWHCLFLHQSTYIIVLCIPLYTVYIAQCFVTRIATSYCGLVQSTGAQKGSELLQQKERQN